MLGEIALGVWRLPRAVMCCATLLVFWCGATQAVAQVADPVALCDDAARGPKSSLTVGPGAIAGTALVDAANAAEILIDRSADQVSAADSAIAMLQTAAQTGVPGAVGAPAASMALFCTAAGEAFRLGKGGSPYQSRLLLLAGFRLASASHRNDLSALAAYRLGLLNFGGYSTSARGLSRAALRSPVAPLQTGGESGVGCVQIDRRADRVPGAAFVTVSALTCAISSARTTGAFEIGAKASVRLARYWLDHALRTPGELVISRKEAARIALQALDDAERVADPTMRFDLVERLVEAAVASSEAAYDPRLDTSVSLIAGEAAGPIQQAQSAALQARLMLARGDRGAARQLLRRAIFLEGSGSLPQHLPDWYLLLAEADPDHRSEHLIAAFRALNSIRQLLPRFDATTAELSFTLRVQPVYEALLEDRLSSDTSYPDDPQRIAEAQALVEEYRQAELQSVFGSECIAGQPPIRPSELKAHEVLLYPVLLPDRVLLIYAEGRAGSVGEAARYHLLTANKSFGRADVIGLVNKMTDSISYGSDNSWHTPARQLYDILIAPVADRLGLDSSLVIIPDGPLSSLPFAALIDAKGRFLIERTNLGIVPSLAYSQPGSSLQGPTARVVAASLEKEVVLPVGTFPALIGTSNEARFAVSGHRNSAVIANFHRADLENALAMRQTDVLHLATHASFNGRSDRSYIVADGEQIPITDLRNLISNNRARGEQLDLLVLSACETAVGDDQANLGLAGAAVQSGARSVLASLWQVNDVGTAELMKGFYNGLNAGKSKSAALRDAQLTLIRQGDELADPGVWAAFILLGGWR